MADERDGLFVFDVMSVLFLVVSIAATAMTFPAYVAYVRNLASLDDEVCASHATA